MNEREEHRLSRAARQPNVPPTRQLLTREARHAAILDGAARAFAQRGFSGTSMERVAAHSGITKLIVYRHFSSKEDLYRAVLDRMQALLRQEIAQRLRRGEQAPGTRALLTVGRQHPDGLRLLLVHAAREPEFAEYAAMVRERTVEAVASRYASADPVFRRFMARVVVSHVFDAVLAWLDLGPPEQDELFVERCSAGISAMTAAWRGTT
jgi:AcrR family transcriptional regulator